MNNEIVMIVIKAKMELFEKWKGEPDCTVPYKLSQVFLFYPKINGKYCKV